MNHQKSSTGGASESGFDPCATLDDLARLLEPTPFLRLGPLAYTLPGRRILVPTLHRMHFLATQPGLRPAEPRQLHALTEGCLGLFDGWMRRQAAWATDSASISLRAWSAFPGTSPAMPYMAALRVGVRWAQDPTLSELAHRWSSMRTSAPWSTRHGPPAPRRDQAPDHPARGSRGAGPTALSRASGLGRPCGGPASRGPGGRCGPLASISPLDARRLLETVTRAASTSVSLGPWPSCDMLGMTAARAPRNTARREGPERAPFLLGSG
ncbi:hypothetical protein PAPYR_9885 [Paratrimastix pyriformis]|uniref:Uncharacterized protein n=1 Tax=Paratrimastix pyriformis TaxID=342808 RepID=A0ABQ8U908_9EUKA|nr:hypothetical protein PAPYR_9885 [Paratrimastix pyriformis]